MPKTITHDEFIERATKLWKGRYDYSLTKYVNMKTKIILICPVHGRFEQKAGGHIAGKICAKCARENSTFYNSTG